MRHTIRRFIPLLGALAIALGGCGRVEAPARAVERPADFIRLEPKSPRLDFIRTETVKAAEGASRVTLSGRVAFDEDHTQRVAAPIDGRVTALLVKLGDVVKAGQPLVQLTSPHVGQLQADAQKALSDLGTADKGVERVHKLKADGAVSEKEVTLAEGDYRKAKSEYARASAQLKALGVSASDPAVNVALRAQISGVVVERNVLVGQEVRGDAAAPLLTISNLDAVWVLADAYEQDLGLIEAGTSASVRVQAYPGETFQGSVKHIGDVVDPATRTVKIGCVVANRDHRLKPEMYAKVGLQSHAGAAFISVPTRALINDGDKAMVIVASEGNTFRARAVEVGPESDDRVRIVAGLSVGETVVTEGAIFMKQEIDSH